MREYVRVRLGIERYAVPVEQVVEVIDRAELTPLPGAPAAILGLQNLRGEVLPAIDLAGVLGIERDEIGPARPLLVADDGARRAGLLVDEVLDVGALPAPAPDHDAPGVAGTVVHDGELVGVLAMGPLLASAAGEEER